MVPACLAAVLQCSFIHADHAMNGLPAFMRLGGNEALDAPKTWVRLPGNLQGRSQEGLETDSKF